MAGLVYVGNYTDSIYGCALGADGALTKVNSSPAGGPAPSFLAKSAGGKFVYATLEGGAEGQIASFSVGAGGALTALNVVGAGGLWPCPSPRNHFFHLRVASAGKSVRARVRSQGSALHLFTIVGVTGSVIFIDLITFSR